MWKGGLMKKSFKVILAAVLLFILSTSLIYAQDVMGIPVDVKIGSVCTFVNFNGITYGIINGGDYYFNFEEYDSECVKLDIIPCGEKPQSYSTIYIQWSTSNSVYLTVGADGGGTYLLGSETGYAEK
jgi:hypothetical protein